MIVTLKGTVEGIKSERRFDNKDKPGVTTCIEVVLSDNSGKVPQNYLLRAITNGPGDRFGIESLIGQAVSAECYINGRKTESSKGTYYSNDLSIKKIDVV